MSYSVALVGAGPTAIYSLQALLTRERKPATITIFERQRRAGQGTPYSPNWSDPIMLANIASIEIPLLPQRLIDWLEAQTDERLTVFGIARQDIDERAFYPRLVVGEYLAAQFSALVNLARLEGVGLELRTQAEVADVLIVGEQIRLTVIDSRKIATQRAFDYVILATGHQWPPDPEVRPGYFTSPWPAAALARIRNCAVAMRGTSLSAIDASVGLANQHGEFVQSERDGNELRYKAGPESDKFSITLFSRKGILPEADFFHPIPYEPLAVCRSEAMQELIASRESQGLLDPAFELFRSEMLLADVDYADSLGLRTQTLDEFSSAYFEQRAAADPFDWARLNLTEAVANFERRFTVPWRYAILRMHEVFSLLTPHLSDLEFVRFSESLKTVFVDNYATVPHESVKRMLALHAAGRLEVEKLDDAVRLDTRTPSRGARLVMGKQQLHFPVFIEATGQQLLSAKDFPFPSLRRQGVVRDIKPQGRTDVKRGIAIDHDYHPISEFESSDRLFCLSLPFLLGQHPFAQGLTSSAEMAEVVADAIQQAEAATFEQRQEAAPSTAT